MCGATGSAKSSTLNTLMDKNVAPVDGMAGKNILPYACTAAPNFISYHDKDTIEGEIEFLTRNDWQDELSVLLNDLKDERGNLRPASISTAKAAHAKARTGNGSPSSRLTSPPLQVQAVYPDLMLDQIATMTVEGIIAHDPVTAKLLGSTIHLSASSADRWRSEIGPYVSAKPPLATADERRRARKVPEGQRPVQRSAALWPLVKCIYTRVKADVLANGVVFVDLPGVSDTNAAREKLARDTMKIFNYTFVLAPITRVVSDKVADLLGDAFRYQARMDGKYNSQSIVFVATKCDDISCEEHVSSLSLEDDQQYLALEDAILDLEDEKASTRNHDALEKRICDAGPRCCHASQKSSNLSKAWLKEDFRAGLRELDDEVEEELNPETFDPSVQHRDYSKIDLPVFTVSARDYMRITVHLRGRTFRTKLHAQIVEFLYNVLHDGAQKASRSSLPFAQDFGNRVRWNTYKASEYHPPRFPYLPLDQRWKAAMVRDGVFYENLNAKFAGPMLKRIASRWGDVFEIDLFITIEAEGAKVITRLIQDIECTASSGKAKEHVRANGEHCLREAKASLHAAIGDAKALLSAEQQNISRTIEPYVCNSMRSTYQRAGMDSYLEVNSQSMFDGAADDVKAQLGGVVDQVEKLMEAALMQLAMKVCVTISALWEGCIRRGSEPHHHHNFRNLSTFIQSRGYEKTTRLSADSVLARFEEKATFTLLASHGLSDSKANLWMMSCRLVSAVKSMSNKWAVIQADNGRVLRSRTGSLIPIAHQH
ncbi:hypothetical protein PUNSTDRAFT_48020 [Punctularia strigosozonata HHB-11173 SS5]|uniref:Uncharacterized protein n=1 Tax=Punctularia strigosozonata (strain HHB-11173) TaxID=741275 RepID=R7RZK7_PUNST|nr:uncharacterized protein PUNSTDRAFT_48020 [Punctularia strigosozonata HHB-11173 SS5]EIN03550.1 hypothetical protein PUNSTDRAFT_48020 [Punctularia strigosozonata HHB-11173 SS5]